MRTITYVAIGFVLLLVLGTASFMFISTSATALSNHLGTVQTAVKEQNWDKAQQELNITQASWDKAKDWWSLLLDHREIDNIDITIERVDQYVANKGSTLALGELSILKGLMDHISDKEALTLRNIL